MISRSIRATVEIREDGQSTNDIDAGPLESRNTDATSTKIVTARIFHRIQVLDHRVHSENLVHLLCGRRNNVCWINLFGPNVPAVHRSRGWSFVIGFHLLWLARASFVVFPPPFVILARIASATGMHMSSPIKFIRDPRVVVRLELVDMCPWPIICEDYLPPSRIRSTQHVNEGKLDVTHPPPTTH